MADNRIIRRLFHVFWLVKRPMTLGVRMIVTRNDNEVLLVRHTYVKGWYLPGGGVEAGETVYDAAGKELLEETGISPTGPLNLVGVYQNNHASRRDHVILFGCPHWRQERPFKPNGEISECRFFAFNEVPEDATPATRRRLAEFCNETEAGIYW